MRLLLTVILSFLFFSKSMTNAYAFFTENHRRNMLYGAFKKQKTVDMYIGLRAGFFVKTWTPNIVTSISQSPDDINAYSSEILSSINDRLSGKYTYSIGIDFGFHTSGSNFRHEVGFDWYSIMSGTTKVGNRAITINNKIYNYSVINGKMINSIGTYADIYKINYSLYYNFENVFNLIGTKWDVFLGGGAGLAYIDGGTYVGVEIKGNDKIAEYVDYDISNATKAKKNRLTRTKTFGVSYHGKIGVLANISQSFAALTAISFGATSRPLFETNFRLIDKASGVKSHLENHISIEVGILLKAYSFIL